MKKSHPLPINLFVKQLIHQDNYKSNSFHITLTMSFTQRETFLLQLEVNPKYKC